MTTGRTQRWMQGCTLLCVALGIGLVTWVNPASQVSDTRQKATTQGAAPQTAGSEAPTTHGRPEPPPGGPTSLPPAVIELPGVLEPLWRFARTDSLPRDPCEGCPLAWYLCEYQPLGGIWPSLSLRVNHCGEAPVAADGLVTIAIIE